MSLIKELQQIIQTDRPVSGRIIAISGTNVVVATASGQIEISANGNLNVGDLVTVDGGQATKKRRGSDSTVYFI
jgi:hypothetical protein